MKLGPAGIPYTREESQAVARETMGRVAATLEPYLARAGDAHLTAHDDGDVYDQVAEMYGVDREDLMKGVDIEGSLQMSAVLELLIDVMHYCYAHTLSFNAVAAQAHTAYSDQARAMIRRLVYEMPDEERPTDGAPRVDVWRGDA